MSNGISEVITVAEISRELERLLVSYQSEKAESQRDDDTRFIDYWDSACQTIYDVAAALNIPLEETPSQPRPYKQRPHQPDSMTPDTADVQLSEEYYAKRDQKV